MSSPDDRAATLAPAPADARRARRIRRRRDLAACVLTFLALMAGALRFNLPEPVDQNAKFAWEYGNTAEAVATGRGFADPFEGVETGPTAWMPPAYVYLIAGVFLVFGVKTMASMWALLTIKYLALAAVFGMLLRLADDAGLGAYRWWMVPAYLGSLYVNRYTTHLALHDPWVQILLSVGLLSAWVRESRRPIRERPFLTALAVVLPLASPSLAAAFVALVVLRFAGDLRAGRRLGKALAPAAVLGILFGASAGVWTVRNYVAFEMFIPVKSNLWFDFVQANELDDDGLATNATFLAFNPSNVNAYQRHYAEAGEAAFTREYHARAMDLIARDPGEIVRRVARRAWNAFGYLRDPDDVPEVDPGRFRDGELEALRASGLVTLDWRGEWRWMGLGWTEDDIEAVARTIAPDDPSRIVLAWERARNDIFWYQREWPKVVRSLTIVTFPTLFLLGGLLLRDVRRDAVFAAAATIYLVHLGPYVLVSHYLRYQTPMIGIQAVFAFFAAATVLETWRRARLYDAGRDSGQSAAPGSPQT